MLKEKETHRNEAVVDTAEERMRNNQTAEAEFAPLFENSAAEQFRARWLEIQSRFVDDPNVSVKDADELVANMIKDITRTFADKRMTLENQWKRGDKVSTEDLRVALKRYRSFFDRLLSLES